jgi:UDP-3-O-[3-hydroxymyristoyl] glucosamine N-acyltransferase
MPELTIGIIHAYLQTLLPTVELIGNPELKIRTVAKIETAKSGDVTFISNPKYEKFLAQTQASLILISSKIPTPTLKPNQAFIKVSDAYSAFVFTLEKFIPVAERLAEGIHPTAEVSYTAVVSGSARIGANVYLGANVKIGDRTKIYPNTVIMDETEIGDDTIIYPNVTLYDRMKIGNRVILHAGVVIGADGFGFAPQKNGSYKKIPQIGIVVIEDDVEVGANSCIDRATMGETLIKKGVKLDNLIQIAHNCRIGEHTVIASQTGVSGSTKIGDYCLIAGQVGFVGHIEIANKVTIGAQSGVSKTVLTDGETLRGYPARPIQQQLRQEALQSKLTELFTTVQKLQAEIDAIKQNT